MNGFQIEFTKIRNVLRENPRGMTITEIAQAINLNRNSVAKYLEISLISGLVEMRPVGRAKVYYLSQRVPLSALLNYSSDFILVFDEQNKLVQVNDGFLNFLNVEREAILNRGPEDVASFLFASQDVQKGLKNAFKGIDAVFELGCQFREEMVYFRIKFIPTTFEDGEKAVTVIVEDVTDRKKAEKLLHESEERFRRLAEQSPNMIFVNKRGRVVYVNQKCEEVMGYKKEEFYSPDFDFFSLIAPESVHLVKTSFSKHMKGEEVEPYEYVLVNREGIRIEALYSSKLMEYDGESAILGTVTDISEIKRVEKELRRSREEYVAVANLTGDIIVRIDTEGNWTFLNEVACKFWGKPREELLGVKFAEYLHPDDVEKTNDAIQQIIKAKQIVRGLVNRQKTSRGWRAVEWNGAPILNESGDYVGLQVTGREVTGKPGRIIT